MTDQAQEEALHPEEGEEEEGENPRNSQTTIQEIHTSTTNTMEEVTTPKDAQKTKKTLLEFSKRKP
jgi:hypothetical protein